MAAWSRREIAPFFIAMLFEISIKTANLGLMVEIEKIFIKGSMRITPASKIISDLRAAIKILRLTESGGKVFKYDKKPAPSASNVKIRYKYQ